MICKAATVIALAGAAALFFGCNRQEETVATVDELETLIEELEQDLAEIQTALPLYTTKEQDAKAAELFVRTKDEKTYDAKKKLLDEALAIEGISGAVQSMLKKELASLVPPPPPVAAKPKSAFQAVSMPKQLPKSKARYSVNMSEMMRTINDAGVTEDPFKQ